MPRPCLAAIVALSLSLGPAPSRAQTPAEAPRSEATTTAADAQAKPETTRARPDSRLAILSLTLSGSDDLSLAARLLTHLKQGLARGAFAVVDPAEVERHAPGGCSEPRCLAALRSNSKANFVLRSVVTVDDRDYLVRLELLAAEDASVLASSEERCDLCGLAEVGALMEAQGALLRRKLEDLVQGPPRLAVTSTPPGALVLVDSKLVGLTPTEQTLLEGQHVVQVRLDGYVTDERRVELVPGVRERLEVPLRREPKVARFRAAGWASLFVGLPVAAAGVTLLALDGRPYTRQCSGNDIDRAGQCRYLYNTDWGGGIALAAGAALITAGVMLLLRTRDRPQSRRPRAFLGPTGVTLVGRF